MNTPIKKELSNICVKASDDLASFTACLQYEDNFKFKLLSEDLVKSYDLHNDVWLDEEVKNKCIKYLNFILKSNQTMIKDLVLCELKNEYPGKF